MLCGSTAFPSLDTLLADLSWHVLNTDFKKTPNCGRLAGQGVGPAGTTLGQLGPGFLLRHLLVSYYLRLPLVLDIMKICMNFGPYDVFLSFDIPEMVDQQNSWNSLIIGTYLLYLVWNVVMLLGKCMYFMTANTPPPYLEFCSSRKRKN
jgi:hypothetical protein